jgi:hypothetical protein
MQRKLQPILIATVVLSGLLYYSANAQEGHNETPEKEIRELSGHPELNLDDDKTLILESEQQKPGNHPAIKEAGTSIKVTSKSKSEKAHNEKGEEDALSFNFLYYIIGKFKISDILDE